jgi:transposase
MDRGLLAHGLIRSSFVPPAPIQELRDLMLTRKQLVREMARHTLRVERTLEDANLKLTRVVSDISIRALRCLPNTSACFNDQPADSVRSRNSQRRSRMITREFFQNRL